MNKLRQEVIQMHTSLANRRSTVVALFIITLSVAFYPHLLMYGSNVYVLN